MEKQLLKIKRKIKEFNILSIIYLILGLLAYTTLIFVEKTEFNIFAAMISGLALLSVALTYKLNKNVYKEMLLLLEDKNDKN